jgi:tetratricopeptide (TPR) repeat protein
MAEEAFSVAARTMEYRSAAYVEMAGVRIQKEDFQVAVEYAKKALDFNRYNIPAFELLSASYRKLNQKTEAEHILNELLEIDPLDHFARFEQYLLSPADKKLSDFKSLIRNELPYETYLELAVEYVNMGLDDEAIKVLEQSPEYPVVYYWLAYLYRNSSLEKSNLFLRKAEELSPFLVFPHRLETIPVLTWAVEKDQSWKSKYYLGLLYWHILRTDEAAALFEQCGDIPDFAPFYISRGTIFRNIQSEYCHPCNDFSAAVRMDPGEWRTWHYLINFLQTNGAFQKELENSEKAYGKFPANPVIGTDHAKALLNSEKYSECIRVLEKVRILPQEGAHEGHDIFEQANLSLAVQMAEKGKYREALKYLENSKNWPENLGAGKPYEPDTRFQDFISAYCWDKLGKKKSADECYARIISFSATESGLFGDPLNLFIANRILIDNGKKSEADKAMEKWRTEQDSLSNWNISSGSSSPKAQWLIARYSGEDEKAAALEKEIASVPAENRFRLFLRTYNNFKRIKK